jgi:alpha-ketoglutarate-dependent taurine dioxygenase
MTEKRSMFDYQNLIEKHGSKQNLGIWIRKYVDEHGFIVLQNTQIDGDKDSEKSFLVNLSSAIGTLIPHNPNKKDFVWEIESKPSTSSLKTFSEHNQHAPLHTDSQYRESPEKLIALMTLRQAKCGGGYTEIADFKEIMQDLQHSALGSKIIDFFRSENFPVAIPSIFQANSMPKYVMSKIIQESPLIRYRYDTLKAGLFLMEDNQFDVFHEKIDLFNDFIQLSHHRICLLLEPQEIILIDNHRFLHGRSSFTDMNRLLLRTRMN